MSCFVTPGSDGTGQITPSIVTSRTSGVAPLGVHFDASATTGTDAPEPFLDLAYCWEFGDPGSGVWGTNGLSRNEAKGPVAAHVFETPGTYEVVLRIRDSEGRVVEDGVTITVTDPDTVFAGADTICFSVAGDFSGAPIGATQVTITDLSDLAPHVAAGKRLLLRFGETIPVGGGLTVNAAGPGMIAAFGSGDRPLIDADGLASTRIIQLSAETSLLNDWRFVDIECRSDGASARFFGAEGSADDLTFLRCKNRGAAVVIAYTILDFYNNNGSPGHTMYDGYCFHDCDFGEVVGGSGRIILALSGDRFSVQGCTLADSTAGEHVLRIFYLNTSVIANNELSSAPVFRLLVKLHDANYSGINGPGLTVGKPTKKVIVSDNTFDAGIGDQDWLVAVGPQNATFDERFQLILVERNFFLGNADTQALLIMYSITVGAVRDNIFKILTSGSCWSCGQDGGTQVPSADVSFRNNTTFRDSGSYTAVSLQTGWIGIDIRNNLIAGTGSLPAAGAETVLSDNISTASPEFVSATPTAPADFRLKPTSPAVGASDAAYESAWDYFLVARAFGLGPDGEAGAAELAAFNNVMFFTSPSG
jgi:hypothetical protein